MSISTPIVSLVAFFSLSLASAQIHVDDDAALGGDGAAWSTAFQSLDDALGVAGAGDEVWVAEGTYVPTQRRDATDPRSVSFQPRPGVRMYGGFIGTEASVASRLGSAERTSLDGSLGSASDATDNAYHVLYLLGFPPSRHWIDRFRISNGYADGATEDRFGGGLYLLGGDKVLRDCIFEFNFALVSGGGLHARGNGGTSVSMDGCEFRWNRTAGFGGALTSSMLYFAVNTVFHGNTAVMGGGAINAFRGGLNPVGAITSRYQNCVFTNNRARNGGAVFLRDPMGLFVGGQIEFGGCTFAGNVAIQNGSAIGTRPVVSVGTSGAKTDIHNCIFWGNLSRGMTVLGGDSFAYRVVDYSLVQGGWPGMGNLSANPRFVNAQSFDLRLQPGSPAIDAGSNALILADDLDLNGNGSMIDDTPIDFGGRPRRLDDPGTVDTGVGGAPIVDLGAFEF